MTFLLVIASEIIVFGIDSFSLFFLFILFLILGGGGRFIYQVLKYMKDVEIYEDYIKIDGKNYQWKNVIEINNSPWQFSILKIKFKDKKEVKLAIILLPTGYSKSIKTTDKIKNIYSKYLLK